MALMPRENSDDREFRVGFPGPVRDGADQQIGVLDRPNRLAARRVEMGDIAEHAVTAGKITVCVQQGDVTCTVSLGGVADGHGFVALDRIAGFRHERVQGLVIGERRLMAVRPVRSQTEKITVGRVREHQRTDLVADIHRLRTVQHAGDERIRQGRLAHRLVRLFGDGGRFGCRGSVMGFRGNGPLAPAFDQFLVAVHAAA